ncbi:MAG TPA: TonB-dependent receptor, partial [Rhodothermales bacterium]
MRYNIRRLLPLIVAFACLSLSSNALAQTTGSIQGRVTDAASGEPLAGANVVLVGTTNGAMADVDGYYYILNIPPGTYDVRASMVGFVTQIVEGFRVHLNESPTLNFSMAEETIVGEEVVVTAETETVKLDVSSSRTLITAQNLEQIPVTNFEEVLAIYPGIELEAGADGSGLVIRGGNINETNIVVDGLSTRDMRTQQPNTTLNLTAINELEVISGGFTAEYGGIRSGMVNVVTREGKLDKYEAFADVRVAPPQQKHFGPSPYSTDGPWWKVYAGPDAMTGVTQEMVDAGKYPFTFIGWNEFAKQRLADGNPETDVTPQEALEIWKWQHRPMPYAQAPDYIVDVTLTGPVPGIRNFSFMASQRYDNLQLAYPMSRKNSIAASSLFKLTAHLG